MSKRKSKLSRSTDFSEALKAWEQENPDAWTRHEPAPPVQDKTSKGSLSDEMFKRLQTLRSEQENTAKKVVPRPASSKTAPVEPHTIPKRRMTEAELMREAFDALDEDNFDPTAKFRGEGYRRAMDVEIIDQTSTQPSSSQSPSEAVRQSYNTEDRAFEAFMANAEVKPLAGPIDKLRDVIRERPSWERLSRAQQEAWKERVAEDVLQAPQLSQAQRKLLKRAKKHGVLPELNLRHYRKHEALTMLDQFVRAHHVRATRFVRIITGKGKRSQDHVVIKPAVLEWCEAPDNAALLIGYSPSPDESGNYGVVILELRRP